ncbi:MAG TPA: T9SS type A sorting domain-containing protein, partial [bacterium]|nr:T9SS type A sorting domain-containing protein [bacterium]
HPNASFDDQNVQFNTRYYYAVTSVDGSSNESEFSTQIEILTPRAYTLTVGVDPSAGGSVSKSPNKSKYVDGTQVTLTATPASGYRFDHWSGDVSGTSESVTITMSGNKSVVAHFVPIQYSLSVSVDPSGGGSVSKSPNKSVYNYGEVVTLTASPNSGFEFDNWSGDLSGTSSTVTVTMNANKAVGANFKALQFSLNVTSDPAEGGIVNKSPNKSLYDYGETVTIAASPNTGYRFDQWGGDVSGNTESVTVTMVSNKTITAHFSLQQFTLNIKIDPSDGGFVSKIPDKEYYDYGEQVRIKASADSRYRFDYWSGDASGNHSNINLSMDSDKLIIAHFKPKFQISGNVNYRKNDIPLSYTRIDLDGDSTGTRQADESGYYEFQSLEPGLEYYTQASRNSGFHDCCVISYDAAIAARIALNLIPNASLEERLSADADGNSTVQMFDAALIAQHAVGLSHPQSKIGNWGFSPSTRVYSCLDSNLINQDFIGLIVGDVDGNWTPDGPLTKAKGAMAQYSYLSDIKTRQGEEIVIPLIAEGDKEILSFDVVINYDVKSLEFVEIRKADIAKDFQIFINDGIPGVVKIGGFNLMPMTSTGTYAEIIFKVTGDNGSISQVEIESYRVNADQEQHATATVVISSDEIFKVPREYALLDNYPNPFNPQTTINFHLPKTEYVSIKIYNLLGQEVFTLVDEIKTAGAYQLHWDGRNAYGQIVPSGSYIYQMRTRQFVASKKMYLTK